MLTESVKFDDTTWVMRIR